MHDPLPHRDLVAVLGLGAAGQAASKLLSTLGKQVIASDSRPDLRVSLPEAVQVIAGRNDIGEAKVAVLSPGLNPEWPENANNPELQPLWEAVREGHLQLVSEIELAIAAAGLPTLCVGGTDGKSTTVALANALVQSLGVQTLFGGNSWDALSQVLLESPTAQACIAEVSAFQLWGGHSLRPRVALLTNIAGDHLDHYADFEAYVQAKKRLCEHLGAGDTAVLSAADARLCELRDELRARGVTVCGYDLERPWGAWDGAAWLEDDVLQVQAPGMALSIPAGALRLPGTHNIRNTLGALLAAGALGVGELQTEAVVQALENFRGLPHRLEFLRELDGVRYFDDSKATNVHAATTGLRSLAGTQVAIIGGVDKALDLAPFFEVLDEHARHVVLIGELTDRFRQEAGERTWSMEAAPSMEAAVQAARKAARPGDAVVLSPGCSSFDMFRSFEHRGEVFQAIVAALGE